MASEEDVYATVSCSRFHGSRVRDWLTTPKLLTSDRYLPGALVLAHSLRDAGTSKKIAVLVTTDTVSADAMVELQVIIPGVTSYRRVAY